MIVNDEQQQFFMLQAIRLGEEGRISAPPNPWVGCLIVNRGEIVGKGYHTTIGSPHAEVIALQQAGPLARGATAFVSLEPCAHWGRTPPCAQALIESGIAQVVIPCLDPDPQVSGKGVEILKQAGIQVVVGIAQKQALSSLEPYLYNRRTQLPFCVVKLAMSIDGRIASADGSSKWITGEESRRDVQLLRASSQAILIGAQTALADQPRLTVRDFTLPKQPLRVLIDGKGRALPPAPLFDACLGSTLIFTTDRCDPKRISQWKECNSEVIIAPSIEGHVDLFFVLKELGKRKVVQLLVEGGSEMAGAFLNKNLVNRLIVYMGNCLLGHEGKPIFSSLSPLPVEQAPRWDLKSVYRFEDDIRLDYLIKNI
ncbi:MAG: bifunctional diaminohydroxyphosphoribosylaminopyrimidine deaminase/5-amino-6-(5-phosphoribosylamino)uracil reductase RibD [Chlamydiales bacterium]